MSGLAEQSGTPLQSPYQVNLTLADYNIQLPDTPLLSDPNFSVNLRPVNPSFDGTVERHSDIVDYHATLQKVDKAFSSQIKYIATLPPEQQVPRLLDYSDKPLAPHQIVLVAQELSLRSASNEVVGFLEAQERGARTPEVKAFFDSPEVMQWRATELQRAGRYEDAARLSGKVLEADARNPEALRTQAMAEIAMAGGGNPAQALKTYGEKFATTGDYSVGMGALNAALEMGDMTRAKQLAPLVSLAAQNVGAGQSKAFWPAFVDAQASIVSGDTAAAERAVRHLSEVLDARTETKTLAVSAADRELAQKRIDDIIRAQGGSDVERLLKPLAEQLREQASVKIAPAESTVAETFRQRGYTSRHGLTPEGFHLRGNVRSGSSLPDSSTTLNDKLQFLEVAKTPLQEFVKSGLIKASDLPPGVDTAKSLYDIPDLETRIGASQTLARGIFDVDGRNLEELHGIDHKIYDSVVRLRITHAGATPIGHVSDEDYETYRKISADRDMLKAARAGNVSPEQRQVLEGLSSNLDFKIDPVNAAKGLIARAEVFTESDTRTNLATAAGEGIGDCRHVAAATEALVSAVQQDKTTELIRQSAESLQRGDEEGYQRLRRQANEESNGYELRIFDQEVKAAVEVPDKYNPILTRDGKFVAAANDTPQLIETHMHNVLRVEGDAGAARYVVADSFYQKGLYRMGWVENGTPQKFFDSEAKIDRLRLSGGEVEAVVVERDAAGKIVYDKDNFPIPVLDENGQPKTVRTEVFLESTKYSSPSRLEIGAPGPQNRLNGRTLDPGGPSLVERLLDPQRSSDYLRQAEFIVQNPGIIETPELAGAGVQERARERVLEQLPPKDVIEKFSAGNATVTTYQTSGLSSSKGGPLLPTVGQADSYAVITSKTPVDEVTLNRAMDNLSDFGNRMANGDVEMSSTGSFASVNQVPPRKERAASFDLVFGARGDSRSFVATVDAQNNVSLLDVTAKLKDPENWMGVAGFGSDGERGGNQLLTHPVDVKEGERVFVFNVSDGAVEPFSLGEKSKARSSGNYIDDIRGDIEAHLKANPEAQDFTRFFAERATHFGAEDNTTIASVKLDRHTDLQGNSVTLGVFDGTGHEDGRLSSALAKQLHAEIPGAQAPARVAREEIDHVGTRKADLARAADPAAVHPRAEKPATVPAEKPAPKTRTPSGGGPSGGGHSGGGGAGVKHVNEPHPAQHQPSHETPSQTAPRKRVAQEPPPAHVTPKAEPHARVAAPQEHLTVHPAGIKAFGGKAFGHYTKVGGHAGHATGALSIAGSVAEGQYKAAALNAAIVVGTNSSTYKAALRLTKEIAPVAKVLRFGARRAPVVGAFITAGFELYTIGSYAYHGEYGRAAAESVAAVAETAGNVVGFGVGDLAREAVRKVTVETVGEKYAPDKSGIRQLGETGVALYQEHFGAKQQHGAQQHAAPQQHAAQPSGPPSIYHYKNLPAIGGFVLKDTPSAALHGKVERANDGFVKNLRQIDFANPQNLHALEEAIHRRVRHDQQLVGAGKPIAAVEAVSSFLGLRTNTRQIHDAQIELRQLQGALRELDSFKHDVAAHNGQTPGSHFVVTPPKRDNHAGTQGGHPAPVEHHAAAKPVTPSRPKFPIR